MNKQAKILWISDLHLVDTMNSKYQASAKSGTRNSILAGILEIILKLDFTHLIFTGDLVFSGQNNEFKELYEQFLKEIMEANSELRIVTIPGNHDINRKIINSNEENQNKYNKYLDRSGYENRISNKAIEELLPIFEEYTNFYNKYIDPHNIKLKSQFQKLSIPIQVGNKEINIDPLSGIYLDWEYKLIFLALNSAWFSWGTKEIDRLISYNSSEFFDHAKRTEALMNSIDMGNLIVAEARQLHRFLFDEDGVISKRQESFNSFLKIGMLHHPMYWLNWNEWNAGEHTISEIVNQCDIILESHVHVEHFFPSNFRGSALVFQSPQLMDYQVFVEANDISKISEINSKNNLGFSILIPEIATFRELGTTNQSKVSKIDYNLELVRKSGAKTSVKLSENDQLKIYDFNINRAVETLYSSLSLSTSQALYNIIKERHAKEDLYIESKLNEISCLKLGDIIKNQYSYLEKNEENDLLYVYKNNSTYIILFKSKGFSLNFEQNIFYGIKNYNNLDIHFIFYDFQITKLFEFLGLNVNGSFSEDRSHLYRTNTKRIDELFTIFKVQAIDELRKNGIKPKFNESCRVYYSIISFNSYEQYI